MYNTTLSRALRKSPLDELFSLERVFDQTSHAEHGRDSLKFNAWLDGDNAKLSAELPGVASEDLSVTIADGSVTISGQRKAHELGDNERLYRKERWSGSFSRTLELPFKVNEAEVKASLKDGVFDLTLPKAEEVKPKTIRITA